MVRIRLSRKGRRNRPFYRIEVFDGRVRRDGRSIEHIGWYDPMIKDVASQAKVDADRAKYWLSIGAKPSGTVGDIFRKQGVYKTADAASATS